SLGLCLTLKALVPRILYCLHIHCQIIVYMCTNNKAAFTTLFDLDFYDYIYISSLSTQIHKRREHVNYLHRTSNNDRRSMECKEVTEVQFPSFMFTREEDESSEWNNARKINVYTLQCALFE
ncbi:hypothetical protein L9F63_011234, partial [Diploptera punctata]